MAAQTLHASAVRRPEVYHEVREIAMSVATKNFASSQAPPTPHMLWRWLSRGVEMGLLVRIGAGNKKEPFRYQAA